MSLIGLVKYRKGNLMAKISSYGDSRLSAKAIVRKFNDHIDSPLADPLNNPEEVYSNQSGDGVFIHVTDGTELRNLGGIPSTMLHQDIRSRNQIFPTVNSSGAIMTEIPRFAWGTPLNKNSDLYQAADNYPPDQKDKSKKWDYAVLYPYDSHSLDQRAVPSWGLWEPGIGPSDDRPGYFWGNAVFNGKKYNFKGGSYYNPEVEEWQEYDYIQVGNALFQNLGTASTYLPMGNPGSLGNIKSRLGNSGGLGAGFQVGKDGSTTPPTPYWLPAKDVLASDNLLDKDSFSGFYGMANQSRIYKKGWEQYTKDLFSAINESQTKGDNGDFQSYVPFVNHPKDMINLQNQFYLQKDKVEGIEGTGYGWNEVPVAMEIWVEAYNPMSRAVGKSVLGVKYDNLDPLTGGKKSISKQFNDYSQKKSSRSEIFSSLKILNQNIIDVTERLLDGFGTSDESIEEGYGIKKYETILGFYERDMNPGYQMNFIQMPDMNYRNGNESFAIENGQLTQFSEWK